ncbi:homeodomain-like, Myb-like domain protein [Artemisia annua]|uniref:Homeodomain-like, Myb-like domain protein n=1 Tax=Artemisia annua TaxID=35608 RepID=A0A2U1MRQ4_ARTAN|nr:homeodomain-like, Myb-like domain protein [Artemisia annua]
MEHETGTTSSLRTRSKAAPDWTVEESLILVNEIAAIEADCRGTLSSFQKWKIIVENCNALEVNRNLNQCRRKWDSLLSDYKKIKQSGSKKASFNNELFKAIERYVREFEEGGGGEYDTDPEDGDEDDGMDLPLADVVHFGSKSQRAKVTAPQKRTVEVKPKPVRHPKSEDMEIEECSSEQRVDRHTNTFDENTGYVQISREEQEQILGEKLRENAQLIEAIVNGNNSTYDVTRMNGDKIIICLSNLAVTLDELSKLQTD